MVEDFFRDLDAAWSPSGADRVPLRIIGSTALFLQTDWRRGTKDSDVLETADLPEDARAQLLRLASRGGRLHRRHRLYVDLVAGTIPFLPEEPAWHPATRLDGELAHLSVEVLDIVDVVVTKL